jgi:hypothetical protein
MFSTPATLGPGFQVLRTYQKSPTPNGVGLFLQGRQDLNASFSEHMVFLKL